MPAFPEALQTGALPHPGRFPGRRPRTVQALGWTPETVRTAPLPAVLSKGAWDQEALQSAWAWGLLPENADSTPTRAQGEAMAAALQELG